MYYTARDRGALRSKHNCAYTVVAVKLFATTIVNDPTLYGSQLEALVRNTNVSPAAISSAVS